MARTVYVVQHVNWNYNDEYHYPEYGTPQKAFLSRENAEAYCSQLEEAARREIEAIPQKEQLWWSNNLAYTFTISNLENITTLSDPELRDHLNALGLPFFPKVTEQVGTYINYADEDWWEGAWRHLGPERVDDFWDLFDKLQFFEVVEAEFEEDAA